jgi:suppressor for copper-sensitivity B
LQKLDQSSSQGPKNCPENPLQHQGINGAMMRFATIIMTMTIAHLTSAVSAMDPKEPAGPVSVQWGNPVWTSATHVRMPLVIQVDSGWKIYGPNLNADDVGQPTTLTWGKSSNVWHVDAHWPAPVVWKNQDQTASVYHKTIMINLDIALKDRSSAKIKMVVHGLACSKVCRPFEIALPDYTLNPPKLTWSSWWSMLGLAFLGGLVLNIMPCVLPVLALKLKSLTQKGRGALRMVCALTAGGIVVGFWILAALTIVLKTAFQQQVGWGMHLQNPYFVSVMVILMMFGGCGLLGVFHINTPQWAGALLAPGRERSVFIQAFLSGLVAVLLATPCSAPFLGTALGFALTGQGIEIVVFYTAIALGFALPYLLGMILPIDKILPRPGAWMVTFEKFLGFFLMVSAGWFVSTSLGGLLGVPWDKVALGIWGVWMVLPMLARIRGLAQWPRTYYALVYGVPLVFSVGLMILPALPGPVVHPISMQDGTISWEVFSTKSLEKAISDGKIVLVDLTGMACPLCIVNKSVFKNPKVQQVLTQSKVVCLRGDFTRADPTLMMFLRKYGRSAIPFNLVIGAKYPKGVILSESLSISEVLDAIKFVQDPKNPL